ncbi:HNH endonuclease protein [Rhizobium phage RHph_N3_13]|nr:HNH endonuclease protein [Rhizobium phage RHph_N3_13]QIG73077.1 HNH endonuclease protein [Rhizobium phage RHph_N3_19]
MKEEWLPTEIDGYEVSNLGRVRSWKPERNYAPKPTKPRVLKHKTDKDGYHVVVLYGDRKYHKGVHTLVCTAFNGQPNSGQQVRHLDGSKSNNNSDNLIWGSPKENSNDKISHGTIIRGEQVNTNKLMVNQVLEIRESILDSKTLAELYNVSVPLIYKIRSKEIWKHV